MRKVLLIGLGAMAAILGTILLAATVDDARRQAAEGPAKTEVLVVTSRVSRLTPVSEIRQLVELRLVDPDSVVTGALRSLDVLDQSLVTSTDLLPGEQVLEARFTNPRAVERLTIPPGLQEVTISLDPTRVLGGSLVVGDLVGILTSLEVDTPNDPNAQPPSSLALTFRCGSSSVCVTDFLLNQVLVTSVQFNRSDVTEIQATADSSGTGTQVASAPQNAIFVTLAVSSEEAAAIVFANEFGRLWLTRQDADTNVGDQRPMTLDRLFAVKQ
jgi:pilus assembly protein CpaB